MIRGSVHLVRLALACASLAVAGVGHAAQQLETSPGPDFLSSLPLAEWLEQGETTEIEWDFDVDDPVLRMDQRYEVAYTGRIRAESFGFSAETHDLVFMNWVSSDAGEWVAESRPVRYSLEREVPENARFEFDRRMIVRPGDYTLWVLMYDETTGRRNLVWERIQVDGVRNDPLAGAYDELPPVQFERPSRPGRSRARRGDSLRLPVANQRPLEVELISTLSAPEQWSSQNAARAHRANMQAALTALSEINLARGSLSITGLDLVRREVLFEQREVERINTRRLGEAFENANAPSISLSALAGRRSNGAFLRGVLEERLASPPAWARTDGEDPLRVLILVTGFSRFERGADLAPVSLAGDCACRVYHLRFRVHLRDLFDDVDNIIKPLDPRTFNILTPEDFRKAIAKILEELGSL